MKTGRFLLGIFFLAGPNISIYDLFPDLIGYLLIFSSIKKMALLNPGVDEGRDGIRKLINISIFKILSGVLLIFLSTSSTGTFDRGWHLTFSFAFAIIEVLYTLNAFNTLLDGLDSTWLRFGSGKGEKLYNNTLMFTRLFIIVKNGLCVVAELPFLMESSTTGTLESMSAVSAQSTRTVLTLFNLIVCLIFGLIWLCQMNAYVKRFRFASFQHNAQGEYLQLLKDKPSLILNARLGRVYSLLKIGCVFTLSFTVWNINALPSFVFGILGICALHTINSKAKETGAQILTECKRMPKVAGLIFVACSFIQYLLSFIFFVLYHSGDETMSFADVISVVIGRDKTALILFIMIVSFTVLEAITFIIFTASLSGVMGKVAKIYTATKYESAQTASKNEEVYQNIKTAYAQALSGAIILGICLVLQQALIFIASIMWFISMLASILFLSLFLRATDMLSKESELRFLYE